MMIFLKIILIELLHLTLPWQVSSKREFSQVTRLTLGPSKKFSVTSHDMKFICASFLMIISISQSKRGGRTTLRSDSIGAKVSKWSFFKNHAQPPLSTPPGDFKKRVSQSGDGDFKGLQKIFCSFPWHEICVCKLPHDHIYLSKQTEWSYNA